jgi:pimeloyl-ACP methyl ester carboxylesterase
LTAAFSVPKIVDVGITVMGRDHRVATRDGRALQVLERGRLDGSPVLVHNGTPNSRLMYEADVRLAERQGIRLISYDRPGYGGSTAQPGRTVADCAADVRAIAAGLGIERLAVWGISGGGPHALACAALLPDIVPAVGVLASVAPWGADGLDYLAGMGELNADDTRLFFEDRAAARAKCERDRLEDLERSPEQLEERLRTLLSSVDAAALSGAFAQYLVDCTRSGLAPGAEGWWEDDVALLEPWGFDLGSIRTPVLLYHGRQDRFVPFTHGEWLAGHIPGVQAELTGDDGHLTLAERHLEQIHTWLLERLD